MAAARVHSQRRCVAGVAVAAAAVGALLLLAAQGDGAFAAAGAAARAGAIGPVAPLQSPAAENDLDVTTARAHRTPSSSSASAAPRFSGAPAVAAAAMLGGLYFGLNRAGNAPASRPLVIRRASTTGEVNYFALLFKGDLPKRIFTVLALLALCRVGYYIPLYGFDVDAAQEYFSRASTTATGGFIDQLFGGGLGRASIFSLGIGPYITASIIFQILTQVTPFLKSLAQGEEGEAGREKYKGYIKQAAFLFALIQGYGQMLQLQPFVFDNQGLWPLQITLQYALGAQIILFFADTITEQKLGNGSSLLVFSSIVANLPRTIGATVAKAGENDQGAISGGIFGLTLLVTILGVVYVLAAERRIPILFAKRLQEEASGQGGSGDAGESYLPIKLNASGVLPLIFAGSLLSLPALVANYTRLPWLQPVAKGLLPGSDAYIPLSMFLIFIFSYISTFQVLDPKDMATNLRKQAAAIPAVRPGKETQEYIKGVLERASVFGGIILAILFVLPNIIEALTNLQTPGSFGGTSLLILVGVAADTWRQLQAELLMQQYATDVDKFYKGNRDK